MNTLGERIRNLRKKSSISQKDLAIKINVSNVVLSRYEADERHPDYETLLKIANFFNVSTDYLLGRVDTSFRLEHQRQKLSSDPKLNIFYKELQESNEQAVYRLREFWEIIKHDYK